MTSSSACATTRRMGSGITPDHAAAEFGELLRVRRWAGVMRAHAAMFGGKTECHRYVEALQRLHLPVEPRLRIGPEAVRPADAGPQIFDAQSPQAVNRVIESMVLEMEPLADAHVRRELVEDLCRQFGRAVLL